MNEQLADRMLKLADVLHWLSRYAESNACILISRWMRARSVYNLDDLDRVVTEEEDTCGPDDGEPVILYDTTLTTELTTEEAVAAHEGGKVVTAKGGPAVPTQWLTELRASVAGEMTR